MKPNEMKSNQIKRDEVINEKFFEVEIRSYVYALYPMHLSHFYALPYPFHSSHPELTVAYLLPSIHPGFQVQPASIQLRPHNPRAAEISPSLRTFFSGRRALRKFSRLSQPYLLCLALALP